MHFRLPWPFKKKPEKALRAEEKRLADFVKKGASVNEFHQLCDAMGVKPEETFRQRYMELRENEKLQDWVERVKTGAELDNKPFDEAAAWARIIVQSLQKKPPKKG